MKDFMRKQWATSWFKFSIDVLNLMSILHRSKKIEKIKTKINIFENF